MIHGNLNDFQSLELTCSKCQTAFKRGKTNLMLFLEKQVAEYKLGCCYKIIYFIVISFIKQYTEQRA
jgi:hypothetical protein